MAATVAARSASLFASHSYKTTKAVIIRPFTASSSAPFAYDILLRPTYLSVSGGMLSRKSCQRRAATLQEKEEQVGVEDYFHVKTMPNIVEEPTDDDNSSSKEPGMVEKWVIKFEQSLNVLLTDSVIKVLDLFYHDRNYARFFVLETIARVPYFAFISVLHMYESFGWWRRADYLKVHFAESWNELHHLLIMEELGGNAFWFDRFLAQHIAIFYYFMTVLILDLYRSMKFTSDIKLWSPYYSYILAVFLFKFQCHIIVMEQYLLYWKLLERLVTGFSFESISILSVDIDIQPFLIAYLGLLLFCLFFLFYKTDFIKKSEVLKSSTNMISVNNKILKIHDIVIFINTYNIF
ncbi:hypothetical protein IEQ34_013050 [Dendrobium chrysotoxum]|uniref:Ubiquinol oxidase n=1 Tax=Dendrobium chrysotoxum TaxID=161865 RepID=A0AAV7GNG7_DENCH|nr:hypothetical protein IEQ34_013050 [Dendrobium chrysotoxum]